MNSRRTAPILLASLVAATSGAQTTPEGWRWHTDRPATNVFSAEIPAGSWRLQEMIPGMHVTTGPGAVLVAPAGAAAGRFMVDADMVLFSDSKDGAGHGIAVGIRDDGAEVRVAEWTAFLVSVDGRFSVVRHTPAGRAELVPWTPHAAILARTSGTVTNRLRVAVEPDSVRFSANGQVLTAVARSAALPDGMFGLRIEEGANLHITNVDITRRLLKRPAPRPTTP